MGIVRRQHAVVAAVLGTALFLAGCGDDSGEQASNEADAVEAVLVTHYAQPSCDDLTDHGREAFGHPVEDGACAQDIAHQPTEDVTVENIEVDGDHATAEVDGYQFSLVLQNGRWLIDGGHG